MNFYNPYYMSSALTNQGFLSNLFRGVNFSSILSGARKTLNFVNQAIPVVKEISPLVKNTKTIFKVFKEFNKPDLPNKEIVNSMSTETTYIDGPTFFK